MLRYTTPMLEIHGVFQQIQTSDVFDGDPAVWYLVLQNFWTINSGPMFRTITVWNPVISLAIDHRCCAVLGPNLPAKGYALHASNDFQRNVTSKIKRKNDMPCLQVTRDILKLMENQDTSNPTVQLKSVHSCRWVLCIYTSGLTVSDISKDLVE